MAAGAEPVAQHTAAPLSSRPSAQAWWVLALLFGVYGCGWFDRSLMVVSMESMRRDLGISDTQLGLLTGVAFSFVYALSGLLIARGSDLFGRRRIIVTGLALGSVLSMLCSQASSFLQLVLVRFGVGAAASSAGPASHALIAEYFPVQQRARALALHSLAIYAGTGLGFGLGGSLVALYGWRWAFLLAGIPGLLLTVLMLRLLREPPRPASRPELHAQARPGMVSVLRQLAARRSFVAYTLGIGLVVFASTAIEIWGVSFLMRVHHWNARDIGLHLAVLGPTAGILGTLLFATLADRLSQKDARWYLWIAATGAAGSGPCILGFLYGPPSLVYVFYTLEVFFSASYMAPILAVTQRVMPLHMRALASSLILLSMNVLGNACGSLSAGLLSDLLSAHWGTQGLRHALAVGVLCGFSGAALMALASRRLPQDLHSA